LSTAVEIPQLRNSERLQFATCPQAWFWSYEWKLKPKTQKPALRFGSLVHSAMEQFYLPGLKRGPRPAVTFLKEYEAQLAEYGSMGVYDDDEWHEAGHLGVSLLEAYWDRYGKDDRWKVLATEIPFKVLVTDPKTGLQFYYVGVLDGLWLDRESGKRKDVWIADHKTTSDDPTKKSAALILDEQAGSYWSFGQDYMIEQGLIDPKLGLAGMMFNFIRKGKPDTRPQNEQGHYLNKDGTVSKKQPAPLFWREPVFRSEHDKEMCRKRIIAQARTMHYMRTDKLEVYKTPGVLHRPHCNWCDHKDMCEMHETGGDWQSLKKALYMNWDPYAQHEIYEDR